MKIQNYNKGFTLLLSVLVVSILLTISMGFSVFVLRELTIAVIGGESQKAVFASDSGIECALYWNFVHSGLSQSAFATNTGAGYPPNTISCADGSYSVGGGGDSGGISSFTLNFDNDSCVEVRVDKIIDYPDTRIEARGHNTCDVGARDRVERAFRVIY